MKLESAPQSADAMGSYSSKLMRKLGDAVDRMPAFPNSVQKIFQLTTDINCEPKDLVAVIEKDPVMTVKILKVINSAYYNLPNKVTSVNRSVVYLGANTIKNLALAIAAIGIFPKQNKAGLNMQDYLFHSLHVAGIARLLCARENTGVNPMECYIAGLLHDFGQIVFAQFMPEEFRQALTVSREKKLPMYLAEREVIGCDHTVTGAMLAEKWQFPEALVNSIRRHHDGDIGDSVLAGCVIVANRISRLTLSGQGGSGEQLPPAVTKRCGGDLNKIISELDDLSSVTDEAQMYSQMGEAA